MSLPLSFYPHTLRILSLRIVIISSTLSSVMTRGGTKRMMLVPARKEITQCISDHNKCQHVQTRNESSSTTVNCRCRYVYWGHFRHQHCLQSSYTTHTVAYRITYPYSSKHRITITPSVYLHAYTYGTRLTRGFNNSVHCFSIQGAFKTSMHSKIKYFIEILWSAILALCL